MYWLSVKIELSSLIQQFILRANPSEMERIKLRIDQKPSRGLGSLAGLRGQFRMQAQLSNSEDSNGPLQHTLIFFSSHCHALLWK